VTLTGNESQGGQFDTAHMPIRVPIELVEVRSNLLLVAGIASRDER